MHSTWCQYVQAQDFQEIGVSDSSDFMHEVNELLLKESKTIFLCEKIIKASKVLAH